MRASEGEAPPVRSSAAEGDASHALRRRRSWRAGWVVACAAFLLYPVAHVLSVPSDPLETLLALLAVAVFGSVLSRALLVDDGRIGLRGPGPTIAVLVLLGLAAAS